MHNIIAHIEKSFSCVPFKHTNPYNFSRTRGNDRCACNRPTVNDSDHTRRPFCQPDKNKMFIRVYKIHDTLLYNISGPLGIRTSGLSD